MEVIIYNHLENLPSGSVTIGPVIPVSPSPKPVFVPQTAEEAIEIKKETRKLSLKLAINPSAVFSGAAKAAAAIGIALILITYTPSAYAWTKTLIESNISAYKPSQTEINLSSVMQTKPAYLPPLDPSLPKNPTLTIPSVGVSTVINEAALDDFESALKKGVWRVSNFGSPDDRTRPTILVAHRYGYLSWTSKFRHDNSFFNLPNLKVGDTVEIDYQQRKYTYEVYAQNSGTEITDYSADLILYTCQSLTGETRIFKYARLIIP